MANTIKEIIAAFEGSKASAYYDTKGSKRIRE